MKNDSPPENNDGHVIEVAAEESGPSKLEQHRV